MPDRSNKKGRRGMCGFNCNYALDPGPTGANCY